MGRYVLQGDAFSCGPISILNAMKWAGLEATKTDHLPFLQFGCRTIDLENPHPDNNGTFDTDFDRVLRYVGKGVFTVKKTRRPTLKSMKKHLANGGAICFSYWWEGPGGGGHYCFFAGLHRNMITVVNDHEAKQNATKNRSDETIKKWLIRHEDNPVAWFLTKTEDNPAI